jgi:eukaryotic-like serine/threonine-protein kinase
MTRIHLRAAIIAVIAAGLAACGGVSTTSSHPEPRVSTPPAAAPSSPAGQPGGTQVITYMPWTAAGTLASGMSAAATQSGSCFTTSSATTAPGAYRCLAGNDLYDPCFASAPSGAGMVGCPNPQNPDSVVVIKLTSPLPAPATTAGPAIIPWLLVLANGEHCQTITGTGGILGGKNEIYGCPDGGVYGQPDQSAATWQVSYAPSGAPASAMTQVAVTKAYE